MDNRGLKEKKEKIFSEVSDLFQTDPKQDLGGCETAVKNFSEKNLRNLTNSKQEIFLKQNLPKKRDAFSDSVQSFRLDLSLVLEGDDPEFPDRSQIIQSNVVLAETTDGQNDFVQENLRLFLSTSSEGIRTILDSGANEFMIREINLSTHLTKEIKIQTASKDGQKEVGFYGGMEKVFFSDRKTPIQLGKKNQAVFAKGLTENLSSVGRICETDLTVIF